MTYTNPTHPFCLFSVRLLLLGCLVFSLASCDDEEMVSEPFVGNWTLVSLDASTRRTIDQRGDVSETSWSHTVVNPALKLTLSESEFNVSGSYDSEVIDNNDPNTSPERYSRLDVNQEGSIIKVNRTLTLGDEIFDYSKGTRNSLIEGNTPIEVFYTVDGNQLTLARNQVYFSGSGAGGIIVTETISSTSVWERD